MQKLLWKISLSLVVISFLGCFWTFAFEGFWKESGIFNQDPDKVISTDWYDENPFREGMKYSISDGDKEAVEGVYNNDMSAFGKHGDAITEMMWIIQWIVNYALGFLALIALVYLVYHGFLVLTAGGDDNKVKKGQKGIRTAAIAIAGIWSSWAIISVILWFIDFLINN